MALDHIEILEGSEFDGTPYRQETRSWDERFSDLEAKIWALPSAWNKRVHRTPPATIMPAAQDRPAINLRLSAFIPDGQPYRQIQATWSYDTSPSERPDGSLLIRYVEVNYQWLLGEANHEYIEQALSQIEVAVADYEHAVGEA